MKPSKRDIEEDKNEEYVNCPKMTPCSLVELLAHSKSNHTN